MKVVFFDVTTLSFASEAADFVSQEGVEQRREATEGAGYVDFVQTTEGLAVGHELFPENTAEVSTLEPVLEKLKGRFDIERVVVVADAAMASGDNLEGV